MITGLVPVLLPRQLPLDAEDLRDPGTCNRPAPLLAHLLGVTRTNLSNQFQDGHRLLDLHKITVTPLPGAPARTLEQLKARGTPIE
ncbi:hypothetical protein [Streptomyces sp. NPDC058424]|uniref:hypothetical protein n=1 Tax=Streptomyces sp. NPDC058424 TaxID=3346491 RepID=UPI003669FB4A